MKRIALGTLTAIFFLLAGIGALAGGAGGIACIFFLILGGASLTWLDDDYPPTSGTRNRGDRR